MSTFLPNVTKCPVYKSDILSHLVMGHVSRTQATPAMAYQIYFDNHLAEQTETEIEEFRSYLDDDAVSYLSGKLLRKQVRDYLSERYRLPMTYVDSFLKQDSLFEKIRYSKSTYYKLITM